MKAYVKSYKEIKKTGRMCTGSIYVDYNDGIGFVETMEQYCEKGPFEFVPYRKEDYFVGVEGYVWHRNWLTPILENKQYLLEFE